MRIKKSRATREAFLGRRRPRPRAPVSAASIVPGNATPAQQSRTTYASYPNRFASNAVYLTQKSYANPTTYTRLTPSLLEVLIQTRIAPSVVFKKRAVRIDVPVVPLSHHHRPLPARLTRRETRIPTSPARSDRARASASRTRAPPRRTAPSPRARSRSSGVPPGDNPARTPRGRTRSTRARARARDAVARPATVERAARRARNRSARRSRAARRSPCAPSAPVDAPASPRRASAAVVASASSRAGRTPRIADARPARRARRGVAPRVARDGRLECESNRSRDRRDGDLTTARRRDAHRDAVTRGDATRARRWRAARRD